MKHHFSSTLVKRISRKHQNAYHKNEKFLYDEFRSDDRSRVYKYTKAEGTQGCHTSTVSKLTRFGVFLQETSHFSRYNTIEHARLVVFVQNQLKLLNFTA